jgi:hypothetical protein
MKSADTLQFWLKLDKYSIHCVENYTISLWSFIATEKGFVPYNFRTEAKEKVDNLKKKK